MTRFFAHGLLLVCLVSCLEARPDRPRNNSGPLGGDRVPGEYVVTTLGSCAEACVRELVSSFHVAQVEKISPDTFRIKLEKDPGLETLNDLLMKSKKIKAVQPNFRYRMN